MIDRFNIGTITTQMVYRIIETGFKILAILCEINVQ